MSRRTASVLLAILSLGATAARTEAQKCTMQPGAGHVCLMPEESGMSGDASGELLALGANIAIGGLTAAIRQWRSEDGSFWNGLWRGAVGGVGMYAGKRIVASDFVGAGLLGRGVAATGASITRNASEGLPMFDRVVLPIGFMRLHWKPAEGDLNASFDVPGIAAVAGIYLSGLDASLDLARTLDTGAPVFMARDWDPDLGWHGRHIFGAVMLRGDPSTTTGHAALVTRALRHERVHVLQYDQAFILWNEPFEKSMFERLGSPAWLASSVDLSLSAVAVSGLKTFLPSSLQVWEDEAHFLAGTRGDADAR